MHRKWNKGQVPLRSGSFWWRSKTRETDNWHRSYAVHESHGTMYIFFYNYATGDDPLREGGWKIIQFGKTNLFLCLSCLLIYNILKKMREEQRRGSNFRNVVRKRVKRGFVTRPLFLSDHPLFQISWFSSRLYKITMIFEKINIEDISKD